MKIYDLLLKLIEKKFYDNKEEIENKVNVFYAMSKITDEEYTDLTLKIEEVYAEVVLEETIDESEEV